MTCQLLHQGLSAHLGQLVELPNKVTLTSPRGKIPLRVAFDMTGTPLASTYLEREFHFFLPPGTLI
jgi:hypothetical protein